MYVVMGKKKSYIANSLIKSMLPYIFPFYLNSQNEHVIV